MNRIPLSLGLLALLAVATLGCNRDQSSVRNAAAGELPRERTEIPDGTCVVTTLEHRLTTTTNHSGDPFVLKTVDPILIDGREAFPIGTVISGVLQDVQAYGPTSGRARMTLSYLWIADAAGETHAITAEPLAMQAQSATGADAGRIVANGRGAAIGTDAGADAEGFVMLATVGDEIELEMGQKINVMMTAPTIIHVLARQ